MLSWPRLCPKPQNPTPETPGMLDEGLSECLGASSFSVVCASLRAAGLRVFRFLFGGIGANSCLRVDGFRV